MHCKFQFYVTTIITEKLWLYLTNLLSINACTLKIREHVHSNIILWKLELGGWWGGMQRTGHAQ